MSSRLDQMRKGTTSMMVLKVLSDTEEPLHGYEIIRRLEASSRGRFRFREGLIYPRLHQMEQRGLLEARWVGAPNTRRRKVYSVTELGRKQLAVDMGHWQALSQCVNRLLGLEEAVS
jgi:DNA-binding PadR family transcriptional regulator